MIINVLLILCIIASIDIMGSGGAVIRDNTFSGIANLGTNAFIFARSGNVEITRCSIYSTQAPGSGIRVDSTIITYYSLIMHIINN